MPNLFFRKFPYVLDFSVNCLAPLQLQRVFLQASTPKIACLGGFRYILVSEISYIGLLLYFHIDAGWQIQVHQVVDRLGRRVKDVNQPLVHPHLVLFPRVFVDKRRSKYCHFGLFRRQRDRARHSRSGALGNLDDFPRTLINDPVIVGSEADSDALFGFG